MGLIDQLNFDTKVLLILNYESAFFHEINQHRHWEQEKKFNWRLKHLAGFKPKRKRVIFRQQQLIVKQVKSKLLPFQRLALQTFKDRTLNGSNLRMNPVCKFMHTQSKNPLSPYRINASRRMQVCIFNLLGFAR